MAQFIAHKFGYSKCLSDRGQAYRLNEMVENSFPVRFGKYILLDRLASGGMAEVFRAKVTGAEDFQRLVAIKCMLPTLARDP